jgi:hypothetical protein
MRSVRSSSIAPGRPNGAIYLVLDDFRPHGQAYRESDPCGRRPRTPSAIHRTPPGEAVRARDQRRCPGRGQGVTPWRCLTDHRQRPRNPLGIGSRRWLRRRDHLVRSNPRSLCGRQPDICAARNTAVARRSRASEAGVETQIDEKQPGRSAPLSMHAQNACRH